jgi:hypothetical protein
MAKKIMNTSCQNFKSHYPKMLVLELSISPPKTRGESGRSLLKLLLLLLADAMNMQNIPPLANINFHLSHGDSGER